MVKLKVSVAEGQRLQEFLHRFPAGSVIFREGDLGREMYIIQKGHVRISLLIAGREREVAVLEKGDFFGEVALLDASPARSATASAVDDVEALELTSADLEQILRRRPEIAIRMMMKLSERLRETNRRFEETEARDGISPMMPAPERQGIEARALLAHQASGRVFPLRVAGATSVGRHDPLTGVTPDVDLSSLDPDRTVSRRHATVTADGGRYTVAEINASTNGTFVNGVRIEPFKPVPLANGDSVQLALVTLRLHVISDPG